MLLLNQKQRSSQRLASDSLRQQFLEQIATAWIDVGDDFKQALLSARSYMGTAPLFGLDQAARLAGAQSFGDAVDHLGDNLKLIDQHVLQQSVAGQWFSATMQDLYHSTITDYTDRITDQCIVHNGSTRTCAVAVGENMLWAALNLINPKARAIAMARSTANGYVSMLEKNQVLTKAEASGFRAAIEGAETVIELKDIIRHLWDLGKDWQAVSRARVTKENRPDKRCTGVKDAIERLPEHLRQLFETAAKTSENATKETESRSR